MHRSRAVSVVVLAVILLGSTVQAADPSGAYFAVIVSDLGRASTWYSSVLHLNEVSRVTDENGRYDIVNLSREGLFVELLELESASPRPEGRLHGPFKVGFLVADLDGFLAALPAELEGLEPTEDPRNELRLVQLHDPDGNTIQVMSHLKPALRNQGSPDPTHHR